MPHFEFVFRREFAGIDEPRVVVEADKVYSYDVGATGDRRQIDLYNSDGGVIFSTCSDRLLYWRRLPDDGEGTEQPWVDIEIPLVSFTPGPDWSPSSRGEAPDPSATSGLPPPPPEPHRPLPPDIGKKGKAPTRS